MANKGRRMVFEEDIKKIGQGGSGATYTAGDGISISDENVISADTDVMATKSDTPDLLNEYVETAGAIWTDEITDPITGNKTYLIATNTDVYPYVNKLEYTLDDQNIYVDPEDVDTENKTVDISDFINSIPLLQTGECSDFNSLPNPKVFMSNSNPNLIDNPNTSYILSKGLLLMKKTATNEYIIIDVAGKYSGLKVVPTGTTAKPVTNNQGFTKLFRSGTNDWCAYDRRCNQFHQLYIDDAWGMDGYKYKVNGTVLDGITSIKVITTGRTYGAYTNFYFDASTAGACLGKAGFTYVMPMKNGTQTHIPNSLKVPTTQGTYSLQVTVDENGAIDTFSWVPVNNQ